MQISLEIGWIYYLLGIAAFLLIAGGAYIFLFRGRSYPLRTSAQSPGYGSRLGLIEDCPLDYGQKLILVRRDHVEHLLFVTPETVSLIESGISPPHDTAHQEALTKPWPQNETLQTKRQHDLFPPSSSLPTSASVFSFSEHINAASHPKEPHDFPMQTPEKNQNVYPPLQGFRDLSLDPPLSGKTKENGLTSFIPPKNSSETIPSRVPPWEIPSQEHFFSEPLEKELEKLHGKVEKLTSELTHLSPIQSNRSDFSSTRVSSEENLSSIGSALQEIEEEFARLLRNRSPS